MKKTQQKVDVKKTGPAVAKELAELGRRMESALRSAAHSGHVREVRGEIVKGVRNVGSRLAEALEAARTSPEGRQVQRQFKKVLSTGKGEGIDTAKKVRENLSEGMQVLSKELQSLARKLAR